MQYGFLPVLYCESPQVESTFRPRSPNLTLRTNFQITSIQFSRVGRQLGLLNDRVSLWNLTNRKLIRSYKFSGFIHINELAYSPNNHEIAFGDEKYEIIIWNTITGSCKHGHQNDPDQSQDDEASYRVQTLDYSPCGRQIVIGNSDGVIALWDSQMCVELDIYNQEHCGAVICVRFSPNGESIVSGSADETIQILDAKTLQQKRIIQCRNFCSKYSFVRYVGYSFDNKEIISVIEGRLKYGMQKLEELGYSVRIIKKVFLNFLSLKMINTCCKLESSIVFSSITIPQLSAQLLKQKIERVGLITPITLSKIQV